MGKGAHTASKPDKASFPKSKGDRGTHYNPDFWYIDGVAYDFKKFVKGHPGGQYAMFLGQGRECTPMIYSYHPDIEKVKKVCKPYECPPEMQLKDRDHQKFEPFKKFTFEENGFYATLKRRVNKHFKDTNQSPKGGFLDLLLFVANVSIMLYCLSLMSTAGWLAAFAAASVHGFCRAIMVVQHAHGASHFALSKHPMVNRWVYRISTVMIGLWNPNVWDLQHVVAHHVYTNEWPYDTDSAFPLKSITVNQRRFWFHKYQHLYIWVIYVFTIPLVFLNSFKDTIVGRQVLYKSRYQAKGAFAEAWTITILGLVYLLVPYLFRSFVSALLLTLYSNALSSVIFSFQFVVNHEVDTPGVIDSPPADKTDWGAYQVMSSNTFAGGSQLTTFLAGGLNTQIEHHLFPGIWFHHYVDLRKIIKEVCKEFGITYNESPNLWEALKCHYRLLRNPPTSFRSGDNEAASSKKSKAA